MAGDYYEYRVQAYNAVGPSAYSNVATITIAPPAPTNLVATLTGFPGHSAGAAGLSDLVRDLRQPDELRGGAV